MIYQLMARKRGTKGRPLNTRPKGRGKAGGKWGHGFKPKNAVARKLKLPKMGNFTRQEQDLRTQGYEEALFPQAPLGLDQSGPYHYLSWYGPLLYIFHREPLHPLHEHCGEGDLPMS